MTGRRLAIVIRTIDPAASGRVHETLWEAFEDADVEIPYPHTHLVFDETSGQAGIVVEREPPLAEASGSGETASTAD
ncbi:hypothetical protein [Halalkalicoccus ordinarius]|uniref:hypothetical protein n=1 Tax=Halalkalicoccus ordinarius TaxID=3116651 RepID=UPI00300EDE3D